MGMLMKDSTTADILYQLNSRFGPGDPIAEMVAIQAEFHLFSRNYSLRQAYRVLHIVPADFNERAKWFRFLDRLKDYQSDQPGVSGHDRIVKAYQENLESSGALPVYMTTHKAAEDRRVTVERARAVVHEAQEYLVISIPTRPARQPRSTPRAPTRTPRGGRSRRTP
jgi:hypothetical protein